MIERNGRYYQTGNGQPVTVKRLLRSICRDGETRGSIHKGNEFIHWKAVEGDLHAKKEYYQSFTELSGFNPDVILENEQKELCFLYGI